MLASEWTKQSAIADYNIAANKITVAPLGANLDTVPLISELKKQKNSICQLLFLGVEWERKGGQIALDTFYLLKKNGVPVQLTIIGCTPPEDSVKHADVSGITVIPFINKHNATEAEHLYRIIRNSDFLLLPTRAECAGVAFCEASAFGIPSITTDTGGVSSYVQEGINGYALPLSAGAADYAQKITEIFSDAEMYRQLCISSRQKYEALLNWNSWGSSFHHIAEGIVNQ
jgi:glycosyltransferase involved in cell wall biosynthesis